MPTVDPGPLPTKHIGEIVNGIRITAPGESAEGICPGKARESDLSFPYEATYLPPNTFEMARPQVLACPDGRLESAHLSYQIGGEGALASFGISYLVLAGEPSAHGTGEVTAITINGRPAVAVAPQSYEGVEIGQGSVVVATSKGSIAVVGNNMPLSELIKIAEGVKCPTC